VVRSSADGEMASFSVATRGAVSLKRLMISEASLGLSASSAGSVAWTPQLVARTSSSAGSSLAKPLGLRVDVCEACCLVGEQLLDGGAVGGVVFAHPAAEGEELIALRHVDACGDQDGRGADLQIEAAAGGLFHAAARPPGRKMGLVGQLVFAEACVAVDAHDDFISRADVIGGEALQGGVDLVDECEDRGAEAALIDVATGFEPLAVVVAFEAAEELEGVGGEVRWHNGFDAVWEVVGAGEDRAGPAKRRSPSGMTSKKNT
jgi:hypothetical protein